ncbi:hypothetical protein [Prosthecobacter fluviatilis]|uniref:Uncharacterized protein n=1 Tax=Prosthecobacter fluviatilis TaxID=445931 RepID=A0ABW0KT28_9BACT
MHHAKEELLNVLKETRELMVLPENDFVWSGWDGIAEALEEFDALVADVESGRRCDLMRLSVLYAPTGSIQEVSISSGWGREFCDVAARFDAALAAYRQDVQIGMR